MYHDVPELYSSISGIAVTISLIRSDDRFFPSFAFVRYLFMYDTKAIKHDTRDRM